MSKAAGLKFHPLRKLDEYLLIKKPLIWATRIHIALFYGLVILLINLIVAFAMPIAINRIPNFIYIQIYLIITAFLMFSNWIINQKLLMYLNLSGTISRLYFFQALISAYVVIGGIIFIQVLPYELLLKRTEKSIVDCHLPILNILKSSQQDSVNHFSFESLNVSKTTLGSSKFADLISSGEDFVIFRFVYKKQLSSLSLAELVFKNSGGKIMALKVDTSSGYLEAQYENSGSRPRLLRVRYNEFSDSLVAPNLYKESVIVRTYKSIGINMPSTPIKVYSYHSKRYDDYIYTDAQNIQASLLSDYIQNVEGITSNRIYSVELKTELKHAKTVLYRGTSFIFIFLSFSLAMMLAGYLTTRFGSNIVFSVLMVFCVLATIKTVFFPNSHFFDKQSSYTFTYLLSIVIFCLFYIWYFATRKFSSVTNVLMAVMTIITMGILIAIAFLGRSNSGDAYQTFLNGRYFERACHGSVRDLFFMIVFFILYPCATAPAVYKLSLLPKNKT